MAGPSDLILPPGVRPPPPPAAQERAIIDNRTGLPDHVVEGAVKAHFVENATLVGANMANTFQTYSNSGANFLTRARFAVPTNVFDEIALARELAEKDDDVRATIGKMLAVAYGAGMENFHDEDETVQLFNAVAKKANLDGTFKKIYREFLIAGQVTTVNLFTREQFDYTPTGTKRRLSRTVVAPLLGVLKAEYIRVLDNDMFDTGTLAYIPPTDKLRKWLEEYFNPDTTPGRKAELGRQDRVSAAMFTDQIPVDPYDLEQQWGMAQSQYVYKLNPRMVSRLKMATDEPYPHPLLTANFALLEAKRLLNIMDYALLQGGANFIVVAKQGSDERPAIQQEIDNLEEMVRRASRSGVIVGDHRLSFDIITPDLDALLNTEKRSLIGRKLAQLLLRVPDVFAEGEGVEQTLEVVQAVIGSDRMDIKRHVERSMYEETAKRNRSIFVTGPPQIWHPKILLQGTDGFTDLVLKLRDRGDIPRKWAVEAGGFDYEAALAQRRIEVERGDDDILKPGDVPFNSSEAGPQDNQPGRPKGASPNNGAPGARRGSGRDPAAPRRTIRRTRGETVRASYDEDLGTTVRVGEQTYAILEQFEGYRVGRITQAEQAALASREPTVDGVLAIVPVNLDEELADFKALRLAEGLGMIVGTRPDGAFMARALVFREPEFSRLDAEEKAIHWGFPVGDWSQTAEAEPAEETARLEQPPPSPALPAAGPEVHVHVERGSGRKRLVFKDGLVVGSEEVPDDEAAASNGRHELAAGLMAPSDWRHEQRYRYQGTPDADATHERALRLPAWHREWDQRRLDACAGFAGAMAMSILNEEQARRERTPPYTRRYEAVSLWNEARLSDEFADNNDLSKNDGTSLRAVFDVLRAQGPRRVERSMVLPPSLEEGLGRNEWLKSSAEVAHCIHEDGSPVVLGVPWFKGWLNPEEVDGEPWVGRGEPDSWGKQMFLHAIVVYACSDKRDAVRLKSSWGDYPEPWLPNSTIDWLLDKHRGEATCIVDR